ncbi:hypothetical protein BDR22DRAFT_816368 [Usnea florida]
MSFRLAPAMPLPDSLPVLDTSTIDADYSEFQELWDITSRAYEIRDTLLRLRTLDSIARQQLVKAGINIEGVKPSEKLLWWSLGLLHVRWRYRWYTSNQSIHDVSSRYVGDVKCMAMAVKSCQMNSNTIRKRKAANDGLLGMVQMQELEDSRGWWRLIELACMQDPHDKYITLEDCREELAAADDDIKVAKSLARSS